MIVVENMRNQLASFKNRLVPADFTVTVETGGNFTTAGTIDLYLSLANRIGYSFLSIAVNVTYAIGNKIVITINSSIIADGEDVWKIIVSGSTGTIEEAVQLAVIDYKIEDQNTGNITFEVLPVTLELTEDNHLVATEAGLEIASDNNFPVLPINGQLRQLNSVLYRYDSTATSGAYVATVGYWVSHWFDTPIAYLAALDGDRGANQDLTAKAIVPPPRKQGNNDSNRVKYWIVNDDASAIITAGTQIDLEISVNSLTKDSSGNSFTDLLSGLLRYELNGYYRLADNTFNAAITDVGVAKTWDINNPFTVPADLDPGYAIAIDWWLSYNLSEITAKGIAETDTIGLNFIPVGKKPISSNVAGVFGENKVLDQEKRLVVVPSVILPGYAIVKGQDFRIESATPLAGIQPDTANQNVLLNSDAGSVRVDTATSTFEETRAVISTLGGYGNAAPESEEITLTTGQALEITLNQPVAGNKGIIRSDYPDPLIAGNIDSDWKNPDIRLFVRFNGDWYRKNNLIPSTSSPQQIVTVSDLATDFAILATGVPDGLATYGNDFDLFQPGQAEIVATGTTSSLSAGDYIVTWYYEYPLPNAKITSISHASPPAIETIFSEPSKLYPTTLTLASAKAIATTELVDNRLFVLEISDTQFLFYWDSASIATADDLATIKNDNLVVGRFRLVKGDRTNYSDGSNSYSQSTVEVTATEITLAEDTANNKVVIGLNPTRISPNPNLYQVADLTTLKAVDISAIPNNNYRSVLLPNAKLPQPTNYYWNSTSTLTPAEPAVVKPDSVTLPDPGRWISNLPILATAIPTAQPEITNQEYWAELTTPDRLVKWYAPLSLPGDWIPKFTPIAIATIPTFNADFVGQRVVAIDTGIVYKADDLVGGWTAI